MVDTDEVGSWYGVFIELRSIAGHGYLRYDRRKLRAMHYGRHTLRAPALRPKAFASSANLFEIHYKQGR